MTAASTTPTATAEALAATHLAAFTQSRPWTVAEFASFLTDPFCFVSGDARCFALVRVVAGEAELLTLATHPEHQRQGRARRCMAEWMAHAQNLGAEEAFLEVAEDNPAARALYAQSGFSVLGQRKAYYPRSNGPAAAALLMKRAIPQGN